MGKRQNRPTRAPAQAANLDALNMAVQYHQSGNLQQAAAIYRQVLDADPRQPDALHLLGLTDYQQGRLDQAIDLMAKSLKIQPKNATAHYNLAKACRDRGRLADAVKHYKLALKLQPEADTHFNLGNVYKQREEWPQAAQQFRAALALAPGDARSWTALGHMLSKMGEVDGALDAFAAAIEHQPAFAEAHFGLCETLEKTHRAEALREAVRRAEGDCPGHPLTRIARAWLLKRDKDFPGAANELQAIDTQGIPPKFAAQIDYLLGEVQDRVGDAQAAFASFARANGALRTTLPAMDIDPGRYVRLVETYGDYFTPDNVAAWEPFTPKDAHPDPVFLVGFPRSGTTLLDTILRGHPALAVVEEIDALSHAYRAFDGRESRGLFTPAELRRAKNAKAFRKAYFQEMAGHIQPGARDRRLIDKQPLNAVHAGAIRRAFPDAKIVMVLRHPCDCVLSCFMQAFGFNDAMANFLDIADAARLYDKVFALWTQYGETLDLNVHTVSYEAMVADLEGTVRPVFDFLDLEWDAQVLDHTKTAQARERINTASYDQVTQKIYARAVGRWHNYRAELTPVLDTLAPWAERFGYDL